MYYSGPNYWSRIILEIAQAEKDPTKFFGTICVRNVPFLFELQFLRPIETMNFKEGLKETEIRKILFKIKIKNLEGTEYSLDTKKEYNFFYNLLVSYAVKLHHTIKNKKILDRYPEINMTTLDWSGVMWPTRSDIFVYMIKTSEVPESLRQKFLKIEMS